MEATENTPRDANLQLAPKYHSTKRRSNDPAASMKEGGGGSLLRAARSGNIEKVINLLDQENVDIATANSNGLTALHLASKEGHYDIIKELLNRSADVHQTSKRGNSALHIASIGGKLPVVQLLVERGADINGQAENGFTPLYMASQEGHDIIVDYLLKNGANQSISTEGGFTPLAVALQENKDRVVALLLDNDVKGRVKLPALHIASRKDDVKAAALLLQNDNTADTTSNMMVNRTTESGFTALHIAAHYGNLNVATLLLNRGALVDFKAKNGITPMHVACKRGHTRFCSLLLDRHGRADACTRDGLLPLHCAARSGHLPIVKLLIDNENTSKFARTKNGLSALHMAAQGGHADVIEHLLTKEYSVDDTTSDYLSALHIASHCGHVDVAKLLLKHNAHFDCKALNGFTPLHVACKKNRIKVVELLLSYTADKESVTESGLTPLHIACFMGHFDIVKLLLDNNAALNTVNVRGETALHMATRSGQTDIVAYLLRNGAKPDTRKKESQTALHLAARLDKLEILKILLQYGATVDEIMEDGYTPLHVAAREGHVHVCETLLDKGASVALTTKKGFTPLHLASKYGRLEVANLLLKLHSSPDACGKDGLTPLHVAAHYDNQQVALLLLKHGASPHTLGKNGYTPLHIAAKKNQMEIALTLLEYGASTNCRTRMDVTPLHLAAQEGHTDMCSVLIAKDANVNAPARFGLTPMHLAAQEDRVAVAKVLYDNEAVVDPLTKQGATPLHVAAHHGNIKVANYLLSLGAKVNAKTKNGYTPLHQASQQGHTHVVNLLLKFGASPNELTNSGNTALSLAKRLGYVTVVDTLQTVTTEITTTVMEEKRKLNIPETVNEGFMSDASDDEGDEGMVGGGFLTNNEMKELGDDSIVPTEASMYAISKDSKYSTLGMTAHQINNAERRPSWASSGSDGDNIKPSRSPRHSGFLVSFMVDARGGSMRSSRHPDMRILVPPKACRAPTRVICRLARRRPIPGRSPTNLSLFDGEGKATSVMEVGPRDTGFLDQLHSPHVFPSLTEGDGLATKVFQLAPKSLRFLGPVAIEVPHFANIRDNHRELAVLRSSDGETWKPHDAPCTDEEFRKQYKGEALDTEEKLAKRRVLRIITSDLPRYFAVVSRPLENSRGIGSSGGELQSAVLKGAKALFPEGSLTKKISVSMQIMPISPDVCRRAVGGKAKASAILTIEPRRRKFHKPITLTIPLPEGTDMKNYLSSTDDSTLRLLCSISGGSDRAQWEDITGTNPLNFLDNCVSFTSTVSARFWLIDCRQPSESSRLAHDIYEEATRVPYMAKFVVYAKSHDPLEAKLRVFCMTDDKYEKSLENQENFTEVARSKDIDISEGSTLLVECSGNLTAPIKSANQHRFVFNAFAENRLQLFTKVRDSTQEPCGRLTFYRLPMGPPKSHGPRKTLCNLNIKLPTYDRTSDSDNEDVSHRQVVNGEPGSSEQEAAEARRKYYLVDPASVGTADGNALERKYASVASHLGIQWPQLAVVLGLGPDDVWKVQKQNDGGDPGSQSRAMMKLWIDSKGNDAAAGTDKTLTKALREINRGDLVALLEDPVFHYEDNVEPSVHMEHHNDTAGFNALSHELGSPFPTPGHVSSPYPFPAKRQTQALSTSTPATKALNELSHEEEDGSMLMTPCSAKLVDDEDDLDKPHFIYVHDDDDEVLVLTEEDQISHDVITPISVGEEKALSASRSSIDSSSTTSGEHEVVRSEPTEERIISSSDAEDLEQSVKQDVEKASKVDDDLEEPQTNGVEDEIANKGITSNDVTSTTTIIRTIVIETDEPDDVSLPVPKVEVLSDSNHVIEISHQVKRTVVDREATHSMSSSSSED